MNPSLSQCESLAMGYFPSVSLLLIELMKEIKWEQSIARFPSNLVIQWSVGLVLNICHHAGEQPRCERRETTE